MEISYLADHQGIIPVISRWFYQEWSYLHPGKTENDFNQVLSERTNRHKIPLALVAFEGNELIGTVCLKINDLETRLDLSPWLAGLYVSQPWRGNGVGTALVKAIERKTFELGEEKLYLFTPESEDFYAGLGWKVLERQNYHNAPVTIMQKEIIYQQPRRYFMS